jgi:hypothetical protein
LTDHREQAIENRKPRIFAGALAMAVVALLFIAAPAFALPERFFGMTGNETTYDSPADEYGEPNWTAMQNAGVQKFRMEIKWSKVGTGWESAAAWQNTYDHYFENAAKHGIAILPYLYTRKAGAPGLRQYYLLSETNNYAEWLKFVKIAVNRYGPAGYFWGSHLNLPQYPAEVWEVWNEPNLKPNCPSEACNGKQYGEFLVGTSGAIKSAKPGVKVLSGGLFQERWNYPVESYINAMALAPGIKAAYDGLSLHPYALGLPGENHTYPQKSLAVSENIIAAYKAQKNAATTTEGTLGEKPIWVTEIGWPVLGTERETVSLSEQASLLNDAYTWMKQNFGGYNIKYAAWYFYKDTVYDPTARWDQHCGLRAFDGSYRAAWFAYESQTGKPKWPADTSSVWPSDNLGSPNNAGIKGDPEVSSLGKESLDVFVRAADWGLYNRYYTGGVGWSGWEAVPGSGGKLAGGPGAVSWGPGRHDVFARGTNNQVLHWWWDGQWHYDDALGGVIKGDPDVASWGVGHLDLFATGTDDHLWHRWYDVNAGGWGPWEPIPGGTLAGGPSAVSWGNGRVDVVARGVYGQVLHWSWDKADSKWYFDESLGGNILTDPAISSWGTGRLDIFGEGSDYKLWHRWYNTGTGWGPWEAMGGSFLTGGAGAVSWGPGRIDVVARAYDDTVYHTAYQE